MAKEEKVSIKSEDMTGEQIATQITINYETIMQAQMNLQQLQMELSRRKTELDNPKE